MNDFDERNFHGLHGPAGAGELLALLGDELCGPLSALIKEIHAVDERNGDDDAAHLVELGYALKHVLDPLTDVAAFRASREREERTEVDVKGTLERAARTPELAASFTLDVRGELGRSFEDPVRFERGLGLCLRLLSTLTASKTRLQVHREVHEPTDFIVLTTPIAKPKPVVVELLRGAAFRMGGRLEMDGERTTVALPAHGRPREHAHEGDGHDTLVGPVLAFRRDEDSVDVDPEAEERAALVLVVDPEPAVRDYMARILELEGFEVTQSSTLEHAYDAAHAYHPEVVILDRLQLSREPVDWVRRFRTDPSLDRIRLVLMQSPESESLGLVGIADVVTKPIDPDELIATVKRLAGAGSLSLLVVRNVEDACWDRCLHGMDHRVITASSADETRRLLDSLTPSALVVDARTVDMPEVLEEMRRGELGERVQRVPVIAVHGPLTTTARRQLESLTDARISFSDLTRRSLRDALSAVLGGRAREADVS